MKLRNLTSSRHLSRVSALILTSCCIAAAYQPEAATEDTWSWLNQVWQLSIFQFLAPIKARDFDVPEVPLLSATIPAAGCAVEPLSPIQDPQALAFEANAGSSTVVNTEGLTPATARALARFAKIVMSVGGTFTVTSAYRPTAYQQHLQAVWDKWMHELRNNRAAECQTLRAQVEEEFTRHQLLETQRPVPFSDHTRGVGFDAAVILPRFARLHRRRVSPDSLARMVRLRRPDVAHDPVHFRFIAARA